MICEVTNCFKPVFGSTRWCTFHYNNVEDSLFDKQFDEMVEVATASRPRIPHPLLNPDSKHYQMVDGVEAIERMEQMYSVEDLMAWAKISAMKYRLRIGKKDETGKEVTKILGFEAYYKYLKAQHD